MPRKKLTEKQLILKRIIEKGIKDWDDDPDYDRIINPERGWDSDFKRYYIYVDAKEFSRFWNAMDDLYGPSLLDDRYDFNIRLMPMGSMMIDLNDMLCGTENIAEIWPKTERNLISNYGQ